MKRIKVTVPTGVGDIFWVHQKLHPHFDQIDYDIVGTCWDALRTRAVSFVKLWDKVGEVTAHTVTPQDHASLIATTPPLRPILESGQTEIEYSANAALDDGIRIDAIDTDLPVAWDVPVAWEEITRPEKYLLVYVSGSKPNVPVWSVEQWADAIRRLHSALNNLPIVVIGAHYDRGVQRRLVAHLVDLAVTWHVDLPAAQVCCLLKHATLFVGFQSGLGILADNFDTPQVMMYFHYPKLWYAWPKKESIITRRYQAYGFADSPEHVVDTYLHDETTQNV